MEICTRYWEALSIMGATFLFLLRMETKKIKNIAVSREKTMMWHQRLGNIGEKGL
jgi:hypothetical protein